MLRLGFTLTVLPLLAAAAPALAQGVVLDRGGAPVPAARVRALLVFQERGDLARPEVRGSENPEDLLVELELAAPAPEGAVWLLAAPAGASIRPGTATILDELSAYWRRAAPPVGANAPPPWPLAGMQPSLKFRGPMAPAALDAFLQARGVSRDPARQALVKAQAVQGWACFGAEVPAGATRLVAHLGFRGTVARYPGALGAAAAPDRGSEWRLPPLELVILHSHFLNVDDNPAGLKPRLGFGAVHQESGTLRDDGGLWEGLTALEGGAARAQVEGLPAAAEFLGAIPVKGRLFLTVLSGAPCSAEPAELDFAIFSHYPSAVEPLPAGRSFLVLVVMLVLLIALGGWLLKRKGLAE